MENKNIPPRPIPPRPPVPPKPMPLVSAQKLEDESGMVELKKQATEKKPVDPIKAEAVANKKRMAISIAGSILCFALAAACVIVLIIL